AEDGIRDDLVTGVQTCALPISTPERAGVVSGTKPGPEGNVLTGRVVITCDAEGAVLKPVEESLVPDYEFSRGFGYSFKELVKHRSEERRVGKEGRAGMSRSSQR